MMSRTVPLIVNIFVTSLARIGLHEELTGNPFTAIHLRRAGEKWSGGTVTFAVHSERGERRILDARMPAPTSFAEVARSRRQHCQRTEYNNDADSSMTKDPPARSH